MIKTTQDFFNTNLNDAITHCVATARKFDSGSELFGVGGNDAASELVSSTITAVYSAVYSALNTPAKWVGTHSASIELRDDVAIASGRMALTLALSASNFPDRDNMWLFQYLFGLPDSLSPPSSPTPPEIVAARKSAGLTQTAAAALIGKPLRTWQGWEAPIDSPSHRDMDPALFELFLLKLHRSG